MANAAGLGAVKARLRKKPSGSIGSFTRVSANTNAASSATAPASSATIAVLPQPCLVAAQQREHEQEEAAAEKHLADPVDPAGERVARFLDAHQRGPRSRSGRAGC